MDSSKVNSSQVKGDGKDTLLKLQGLQVVLINLERSVKRREQMQRRLHELGLAYHWLKGVDGKLHAEELLKTVDVAKFERNVGRDVLLGEIGCYHSHLKAWQYLLETSDDTLLVLEDDVVFGDGFLTALELALQHKSSWDFLKLNKIRAKQPVCQQSLGSYALNAYIGPATGFGAYLIQRHTIESILPRMLPIRRPIDHEADRIFEHDFRHFGLEPFPSEVRDEQQSTITGSQFHEVKRRPLYQRVPSYLMRFGNQIRRILYLARKGRLIPKRASN